ncbi:MAG TPA: adenylate kinase [Acidimicrobiales bacterium]|nr:adenylate kinase [Acidimicrobiales bacterium]
MRLLMVAPPGAGKGTQATRLAAHYGIAHLSSGELFRREVEAGTEIGRAAAGYVARGDLVPDRLVLDMLGPHVLEAAAQGGYVLDGYPRTRAQAEEAYQVAQVISGIELQAVVHLEVGRAELLRRLLARARMDGRADDTEPVIRHRLAVYDDETAPMLEFYAGRGLVVDIDGEQAVEDVFGAIVAAVDALRPGLA